MLSCKAFWISEEEGSLSQPVSKTDKNRTETVENFIHFWRGSIHREAEAGVSARKFCRKHAISDATFYTWLMKYGVLKCLRLTT